MAKYGVIILGEGIHLSGAGDEVATGFIAVRSIKAVDEQDAIRRVSISILQDWKALFNRDNTAGTPALKVERTKKTRNPFKTFKVSDDFMFYFEPQGKSALLEQAQKVVS